MDKEDLIAKVRHRPFIWDKRMKEYSMRHKVDECWREIAHLTNGYSERELRKKWKHLRDQFSVELKKSTQVPSVGSEVSTPSKWTHYESMLFLKDVLHSRPPNCRRNHPRPTKDHATPSKPTSKRTPHPKTDEGPTTEDDDAAATDEEELSNSSVVANPKLYSELSNSSVVATPKLYSLLSSNKRRRDSENEGKVPSSEDVFKLCTSDPENDDMLFFRSLLPYVGLIPTHLKLKFRSRVQEIVDDFAFPEPNLQLETSLPTSSHSICNSP